MIKKEITICGKQVTLAYCFATEISYKVISDEEITDFVQETVKSVQDGRMPNTRKSIFAILAAASAYYESINKESPITDKELMFDSTSTELATAIGTVIALRAEFYHVPKDEQEEEQKENDQKNA